MPKRIDLGDDGSKDELAKALEQLQRPRQKPVIEREQREEVQDAVREIAEQRKAEAAVRRRRRAVPPWAKWAAIGAVLAAVAIAVVVVTRPEPLPPPAASPQEAVRGFWQALIDGRYEAATVYYPSMVQTYGSRKQAALKLREQFGANPPVRLSQVGEPEQLPDSGDYRVTYEISLRSGAPRGGEAIVADTREAGAGFAIIAGI
jgi:negative regulator of sigma E activity